MKVQVSTTSNINNAIDSAIIDIEVEAHGAIFYIKGIDVNWDYSIISRGQHESQDEYCEETTFDYYSMIIDIITAHSGIEIDEGTLNHSLCMRLLGDVKQFEGAIIDFITSKL